MNTIKLSLSLLAVFCVAGNVAFAASIAGNDFEGGLGQLGFVTSGSTSTTIQPVGGELSISPFTNDPTGQKINEITFDLVDLSQFVDVTIVLDFSAVAGQNILEVSDTFSAEVQTNLGNIALNHNITNSGAASPLFSGNDSDVNYSGQFSAMIPDAATSATLVLTSSISATNETFFVDNVSFDGQRVPEPHSLALAALGLLGLGLRRRD